MGGGLSTLLNIKSNYYDYTPMMNWPTAIPMSNEVLSWRYSTLNEACMKGKIDTLIRERRRGRREVGEEGGKREEGGRR